MVPILNKTANAGGLAPAIAHPYTCDYSSIIHPLLILTTTMNNAATTRHIIKPITRCCMFNFVTLRTCRRGEGRGGE